MKRIAAMFLLLALILPLVPAAKADTVAVKPYYGIGSSDFNRVKFPNLEGRLTVNVGVADGQTYFSSSTGGKDINKIASILKTTADRYPEGMRHLILFRTSEVFQLGEDVVYLEKGVNQLKEQFTTFIKAYAEAGGKLDSLILDVEYVNLYSWYIYTKAYTKGVPTIYADIVKNPLYQTEIRPMLVERGFVFYEDPSGAQSEIFSIYPRLKGEEKKKYAISQEIWDTVMRIRLNNYMTEAIYEPLAQYMPGVALYDYQSRAIHAWNKDLSDTGEHSYITGNSVPVGITSHYNTYGSRLGSGFFTEDNQPVYKNPVAYNNAVYDRTPYHHFLWDINLMKNMYAASGGKVSFTVAEYDYSPNKVGTPSNTPYYTETVLHIGLLDPQPFSIYMYDKAFESTEEYNKRAQVLQDIMAELTRVAGYADRKPIAVPSTWNSSFVLSGIYANGRNLWRLTPDTSKGTTLESFQVKAADPTFSIDGQTVTFPQGKIIADGQIGVVGTCGYWIETPKDVTPIVTTDPNRFSQYPAFSEDFESYASGAAFDSATANPKGCWTVEGTPTIQAQNGNQALALTGNVTLSNTKLPQNITAGDNYAKEQIWEVSFCLTENLPADGELKLLTCGDGGIKIAGDKVYYDENGSYKALNGVTLTAGQSYTVRRRVDFRTDFVYDFAVMDAAGKVIGEAKTVAMAKISLPVAKISISCANVTGQVLLDDYKLYPTGVAADLEVYNAQSGILLQDTTQKSSHDVAYRLSWLNGSEKVHSREVIATFYDAAGKEISSQTLKRVEMQPGCDNVETGIVQVPQGQAVVLQLKGGTENPEPTVPTTEPTTAPTTAPTVAPTVAPTTVSTAAPTVTPTGQATNAPTEPAAKDTENSAVWIVLAVVSLGIVCTVIFFRLGKKKNGTA